MEPFDPPRQPVAPDRSWIDTVLAGVIYGAASFPFVHMLLIMVSLADICAPPNPAMGTVGLLFWFGGPLIAAGVAMSGFAGLESVRAHTGWRYLLSLASAGITAVLLMMCAHVLRGFGAGATGGEVFGIALGDLPSDLVLGVIGAVCTSWLPFLIFELVLRARRR